MKCINCKFFKRREDMVASEGECRRFPPDYANRFSRTYDHQGCGEFQALTYQGKPVNRR